MSNSSSACMNFQFGLSGTHPSIQRVCSASKHGTTNTQDGLHKHQHDHQSTCWWRLRCFFKPPRLPRVQRRVVPAKALAAGISLSPPAGETLATQGCCAFPGSAVDSTGRPGDAPDTLGAPLDNGTPVNGIAPGCHPPGATACGECAVPWAGTRCT